MDSINVLIVGVGGQGVILASDIISEVAMGSGYDVKKSDSIGMAQRGGSVVSHVRIGEKIFSPLIPQGEVDFLIGFEELEALRWAPCLKKEGVAIVADVTLIPLTVIESNVPYPEWETTQGILKQNSDRVYHIPVSRISQELNNPRALNMVLLGCLAGLMDADIVKWEEIIKSKLSPRFYESNLAAFKRGITEAGKIKKAKEG
jgi:indolepyruvate ferredoxin oxidoreductase beta subunit